VYSITENINCSQLSSVAILLQPEPVSHRIIQENDCVFSPSVLSSFCLHHSCHVSRSVSEARSYFASTIWTDPNIVREVEDLETFLGYVRHGRQNNPRPYACMRYMNVDKPEAHS
jgi:hypothetical protein